MSPIKIVDGKPVVVDDSPSSFTVENDNTAKALDSLTSSNSSTPVKTIKKVLDGMKIVDSTEANTRNEQMRLIREALKSGMDSQQQATAFKTIISILGW
jgi:hypothetical protein